MFRRSADERDDDGPAVTIALLVWVLVGCLYWVACAAMIARTIRAVPLLADTALPERASWPRLSVIIPACDEAATLEAAMAAKLSDTYPDLELVLIDDRSTDGTGALVDRIAAADPRVRAIHVTELPAGWLGKVHAMQKGLEAATGELLLLTDADVHFAPGTLARAVAHLEARGADHLAVLPSFRRATFLVDAVVSVACRMIGIGIRAWGIEDPKSSAFIGVGAFNLVRRAAFERTAGFEWLRLEICDDMALGMMLKQSGARSSLINGRGLVTVQWYSTVAGYARGIARAGFAAIGRFSAVRMIAVALLGLALESAPFAALAMGGHPWLQLAGAATIALALGTSVAVARWLDLPTGAALALPVGVLLQFWTGVRGALTGARLGGVDWRGTFYSSAVLRPAQRVRIP